LVPGFIPKPMCRLARVARRVAERRHLHFPLEDAVEKRLLHGERARPRQA
jgi:hypothetical protein